MVNPDKCEQPPVIITGEFVYKQIYGYCVDRGSGLPENPGCFVGRHLFQNGTVTDECSFSTTRETAGVCRRVASRDDVESAVVVVGSDGTASLVYRLSREGIVVCGWGLKRPAWGAFEPNRDVCVGEGGANVEDIADFYNVLGPSMLYAIVNRLFCWEPSKSPVVMLRTTS